MLTYKANNFDKFIIKNENKNITVAVDINKIKN